MLSVQKGIEQVKWSFVRKKFMCKRELKKTQFIMQIPDAKTEKNGNVQSFK